MWFTDGKDNIRLTSDDDIPVNFYRGRVCKQRHANKRIMTPEGERESIKKKHVRSSV
jgi:hypothetical protein